MKLWELFKDEYEGRIVEYKNREGDCRFARVGRTDDGKIALIGSEYNTPLLFSQSEMQDYDFEFKSEPLTFNELAKADVYGKTIKVEIGDYSLTGIFCDILEKFSRENCSYDCMKLFTVGRWYIMD